MKTKFVLRNGGELKARPHDTQHNEIWHFDTQHNDTQHNDIEHNDTKH